MPGFRKKQLDEQMIQEKMLKATRAWAFQFEKNIKDYVDIQKCQKTVLEEV